MCGIFASIHDRDSAYLCLQFSGGFPTPFRESGANKGLSLGGRGQVERRRRENGVGCAPPQKTFGILSKW